MTNKIDAGVEGGELLDQALAQLPSVVRQKILPKALKAAGVIVQQSAKSKINSNRSDRNAPGLAKTIIVKVRVYDTVVSVVIGPSYLGVNHAHLVEFGHRLIKSIKSANGGSTKVQIGFVQAHPFLRPAADETRSEQDAAIVAIVTAELAKWQGTT